MTERYEEQERTDLATVFMILTDALSQPEPQREQLLKGLQAVIAAMLDDDRIPLDSPGRANLRLIQGGLAGGAAGVAAVIAALARRPAAAAATAGAVAVASTAAAALYLGGDNTPSTAAPKAPAATTPVVPGPRHQNVQPSATPQRPKPSASPKVSPRPQRALGRRVSAAGLPSVAATVSAPPVASLPPISPSPLDQHPTAVRMLVRSITGLRVRLVYA